MKQSEFNKLIRHIVNEAVKMIVTEDYHHLHKDYRLYEGSNHITALFEDGSRLAFEVHYRNKHGEDKEKWRHRAFSKWKSLASKIHNDVQLSEAGNPMEKSWKECFEEALKHPDLQEFIRNNSHQKIFGEDNPSPIYDPVNFTKMG